MNFGVVYAGLKKGWNTIKGISSDYIDMIETNNLFEVSMGKVVDQYGNIDEAQSKYYTKAIAFQNEMNEKLGTNKKELMEYQAMYFSMLKSQGINKNASYLMSESLTKAGYDIASLYNLSVDDAMSKLKSGLAGQVEPLRKIGIDISESSLQKVLNDVGIDRKVQQLSYAEKEVARYIAIMNQAQQAQGDFARTMDSSANQIKIFKSQIAELKQVAGAFIVNTFGSILVYVNAIIMVLKEILKAFANLFGYDLSSGGADLSTAVGIDGLTSGLDDASKKAKELKKQLMGFDEINNITPATQTSSSGSSGVGGIDSKLLNDLKKWDNKMSSISGKAQEIRDKMLDWLGFVRNDDGTWRLGEGLTNFEKILDVVKAIGLAILTWKVSSAVTNVLKSLGILGEVQAFKIAFGLTLALSGIYLAYKGISHLIDGDVDLFTILETALGTAMGTFGIVNLLNAAKIGKTIPLKNQMRITAGLTIAITSITAYFGSKEGLKDGDISSEDILKSVGSIIEATVGVGMLTKSIPLALILSAGLTVDLIDTIGNEQLWYPLKKLLDLDFINNDEVGKSFKLAIDITSFDYHFLENIFGEDFSNKIHEIVKKSIKEALLKLADFLENFSWIGKGLAEAIRAGVTKSEKDTQEHIEKSVSNSITDAQPVIDATAEESGIQTMLKLKRGISEQQENLKTTIQDTQNNSLINARASTDTTAKESGSQLMQKAKEGITNKFNELRTAIKDVQSNAITNNRTDINNTAKASGMQLMQSAKQGISSQTNEVTNATGNIASKANTKFSSNVDGYSLGSNTAKGIANGINGNSSGALSAIGNLGSKLLTKFKNIMGIHSPSKVMADLSKYIPLGMAKGIDSEADTVYASMKKINEGIKVNAKDLVLDTNQYVDYGTISGQIQAQSNISLNSNIANRIAEASYNAFCKAMRDEGVKVDIEAKTDEGVIFKKVQSQAEEFAIQTGENPFPVLA